MTRFNIENISLALESLEISHKISDKNELKMLFRKFSSIHHPDKGGDLEKMKQINWAYDFLCANFEKIAQSLNNEIASLSEEGQKILNELQKLEGLKIDVVGCWIWVDGDTKPNKEALKILGMKWHVKKLKWFFAGTATRSRSSISYEEIKAKHGSQSFRGQGNKKLN